MKKLTVFSFLIFTASVLSGCGEPAQTTAGKSVDTAESKVMADASKEAEPKIEYNLNDPELIARGKQLFILCQACHALKPTVGLKVGPHLQGIVNRKAAAVEGFAYSPALIDSGVVWDRAALDQWMQNPALMIPGNIMSFQGLNDEKSRMSIIAYLSTL